jgi:hypothetical protein
LLIAGLSTGFNVDSPGPNCSGACINVQQCKQDCNNRGFSGGQCVGTTPRDYTCCCHH